MVDITSIDKETKTVVFDNGESVDYQGFIDRFRVFMKGRIAGESLYPADMERFMRRTSGKNLSHLMKGKKMEGYMEGVSDKLLTKGQKIAIGSIATIIMVAVIAFVVLKNQGIIGGVQIMVKDKDLWKYRSWELSIDELKTKQKRCRRNMWFTFIVFYGFLAFGCFLYNIGIIILGGYFVTMGGMMLLGVLAWKYFEMNYSNIIEIRLLKED